MTTFDRRKDAFEEKFAHDAEMQFRAEVHACKLFGLWVAEQLGLSGTEADTYAREVVAENMTEPGFDDVKRFVRPDLDEKGVEISDHMLDNKLAEYLDQSKAELAGT